MDKKFYNRGYYGTVSHNSKAQYQMYFGWYDGNPANLNPLPPVELPENKEAKQLLADTYSQLGYQAESGPWRNFYLTGAQELLNGGKNIPNVVDEASLFTLSPDMLFDFMAIQVNGEKAAGENLVININLIDLDQKATLILRNGALTSRLGILDSNPTSTISLSKTDLTKALINPSTIDQLPIKGDKAELIKLLRVMDKSNPRFNIIEP